MSPRLQCRSGPVPHGASRRSVLLLLAYCAVQVAAIGERARLAGHGSIRRRRRPAIRRCCAAHAAECAADVHAGNSSTACCYLVGAPTDCAALLTRERCERAHVAASSMASASRELCAWIGGRCNAASAADCPEPADEAYTDYYGERAGFAARCGSGRDSSCPGLRALLRRYARAHDAATRELRPPGGIDAARLLVIRDHWKNVGMGFMPQHVAAVVLFCASAGIYFYVENYGRYDWTSARSQGAKLTPLSSAPLHRTSATPLSSAPLNRTSVTPLSSAPPCHCAPGRHDRAPSHCTAHAPILPAGMGYLPSLTRRRILPRLRTRSGSPMDAGQGACLAAALHRGGRRSTSHRGANARVARRDGCVLTPWLRAHAMAIVH